MFGNVILSSQVPSARPIKISRNRPTQPSNNWCPDFVEKIRALWDTTHVRMEQFANETLMPVFEDVQALTSDTGLSSSVATSESGVLTFRFAMGREACLLMTIRPRGLGVDVLNEFSIPCFRTISPTYDSTDSLDGKEAWVRRVFEDALDLFADSMAEAFAGQQIHERLTRRMASYSAA